MKKLVLVIILVVFICSLFAIDVPTQDEMNTMYMSRLDVKLADLTKVLGTYNDTQKNMEEVENLQYMNDFLFQMTMEIGKVRKLIIESEDMNESDRVNAVTIAISSVKSDTEYDFEKFVADEVDKSNKIQLAELATIFHKRLTAVRKAKLEIEKQIAETKILPYQYMDYLSQEFVYSYTLAFADISSYLSKSDRDYLTTIINSLADAIDKKNATQN